MLCTMRTTSLCCSVDTLHSIPDFTGHYFLFHPMQTISCHNCITWKIQCLCDKVALVKYWYILNLNSLSSFPLAKNQAACRSIGKWRLGVGMMWHLPNRTSIHVPQTTGFQKLCFYSKSQKSYLYRWLLGRDDWDPREDKWRYWSDERSFCWKSNGSKNGIFFWRERSRTGIMGTESMVEEILAFYILGCSTSRQVRFTCDNFPSASGRKQYDVQDNN